MIPSFTLSEQVQCSAVVRNPAVCYKGNVFESRKRFVTTEDSSGLHFVQSNTEQQLALAQDIFLPNSVQFVIQ